jgi:hypothetical protein
MFNSIMDTHVNWCPYNSIMTRLPSVVHRDMDIWMARVPLIHFSLSVTFIDHNFPSLNSAIDLFLFSSNQLTHLYHVPSTIAIIDKHYTILKT